MSSAARFVSGTPLAARPPLHHHSRAAVDQTCALRQGVDWLVRRLRGHTTLVIPIVSLLFATLGALSNTQEEIVGTAIAIGLR